MDLWISFGLFRSDFLNVLKQISFQKHILLAFDGFSSFRVRGKDKKTRALRGKYQTGTSWDVGALCHTHNCCLLVYRFFAQRAFINFQMALLSSQNKVSFMKVHCSDFISFQVPLSNLWLQPVLPMCRCKTIKPAFDVKLLLGVG